MEVRKRINMNRKSRRRQAHKNRSIMAQTEVKEEILKKVEQQLNDGRVEAMMLCVALGLNEEFRFGKKRCLQVLKAIDDLMKPWVSGECDTEDLRNQVNKKIGIDVRC